jgi:hypothetical protein
MAEPEVEAAWRAEFERSGAKELRDALDGDGFTNELKRQLVLSRWDWRYCVEGRSKLDRMIRLASAFGTKQAFSCRPATSALGSKADMTRTCLAQKPRQLVLLTNAL